jgi:hypothetical protein
LGAARASTPRSYHPRPYRRPSIRFVENLIASLFFRTHTWFSDDADAGPASALRVREVATKIENLHETL